MLIHSLVVRYILAALQICAEDTGVGNRLKQINNQEALIILENEAWILTVRKPRMTPELDKLIEKM